MSYRNGRELYRNGRELRDLVPLWKDALWKGGLGEGEAGGKGED